MTTVATQRTTRTTRTRALDAADRLVHDHTVRRSFSSLAVTVCFAALAAAGCGGTGQGVVARSADGATGDGPAATTPATSPGPSGQPGTVPPATAPPATSGPEPTATPAGPPAMLLSPYTVVDPAANGVDAFTVLVPEGWQASGSVQWLPFWSRLAFLQTRVHDPATGLTIDWLPIQDFMYFTPPPGFEVPLGGNYQGKAYVPPIVDPLQFVRDFWMSDSLSHLQNATVAWIEEQPAVAGEFLRLFGGAADAGAWRIRYEYLSDGVPWEQDVSFALLWSGNDPVSWYVNFASTAGAPKGELDRQESLVSSVIASRIATVEWEATYRLVQQLFYQGIQQQMADTVRFGELLAQYRAESQALQQQVFDERMASIDRRNEVFRDTLGGVQGYDDPVNGGVVQLPLGWDTYWVNEQGEYIVVSDPNFDPNTMNDGTWQQLEPRP